MKSGGRKGDGFTVFDRTAGIWRFVGFITAAEFRLSVSFTAEETSMGLDSVELIMAVEEKFGIEITDKEAGEIRTVGDMHQVVVGKLSLTDKSLCWTQKAFYLLRRNAISLFGVARHSFTPDTKLGSFIPKQHRRQHWLKFQSSVGAMH